MTEQEQILYLANIFHVARADGRVEVIEDGAAEAMAAGIGAGYLQTRKALDLSLEKDFKVYLPARLSERMRNLEDMLEMAYVDADLHAVEKGAVVDFAKQVGVTQEQLRTIQREVQGRVKERG